LGSNSTVTHLYCSLFSQPAFWPSRPSLAFSYLRSAETNGNSSARIERRTPVPPPLWPSDMASARLRNMELNRLDVLSSPPHSIKDLPFVSPPKTDKLRHLHRTSLPVQFSGRPLIWPSPSYIRVPIPSQLHPASILMRTSLDRVVYGSIPRPTSLLWSTVRSRGPQVQR
jgi:hypothetical protein